MVTQMLNLEAKILDMFTDPIILENNLTWSYSLDSVRSG